MTMDKTFDAGAAEPRLYAAWEDAQAFRAGANAQRDETFCIMIPPPNVTGSAAHGPCLQQHAAGHPDALAPDARLRHAVAAGHRPCRHRHADGGGARAGEERRTGPPRDGARGLRREGLGVEGPVARQRSSNQLKRLGASCDWDREAFTMSGAPGAPAGEEGNFHDAVIRVFVEMYEKGFIYRGKRLVNWDPHFETAISDLEVEQVEVDGHMWRLRYPLEDG
jgi:valyl-tRNA synthetase